MPDRISAFNTLLEMQERELPKPPEGPEHAFQYSIRDAVGFCHRGINNICKAFNTLLEMPM